MQSSCSKKADISFKHKKDKEMHSARVRLFVYPDFFSYIAGS